jgi:hypothetical protein
MPLSGPRERLPRNLMTTVVGGSGEPVENSCTPAPEGHRFAGLSAVRIVALGRTAKE